MLQLRRKTHIYSVKKRKAHDYIDKNIQLIEKRTMISMFSQFRGKLPINLTKIYSKGKLPTDLHSVDMKTPISID